MITCSALITRTYKRARPESIWPETLNGPNPNAVAHKDNVCGGRITVSISVTGGGCCCAYGDPPEIDVTFSCSRCRNPYFPGRFSFTGHHRTVDALEKLINDAFAGGQP